MTGSQVQAKRSQAALAAEYAQRHFLKEGRPSDDTINLWLEAVAPGMMRHDVVRGPDAADQLLRRLTKGWTMSWAMACVVGDQLAMVVWDRGTLDTGTLPMAILDNVEGAAIEWSWSFRPALVMAVFGAAAGRMMESARRRAYAATEEPGRAAWSLPMNVFKNKYQPRLEVMVELPDGTVGKFRIVEMPVWMEQEQKPCLLLQGGAVSVPLDRIVEPLDLLIGICKACWLPSVEAQIPQIAGRLDLYDGHLCWPGHAQDFHYTDGGFPAWLPDAGKALATKRPSQWMLVVQGEKSTAWIVAMTDGGLLVTGFNPDQHTACSIVGTEGYRPKSREKVLDWLRRWGFKVEGLL